MRTSGSTTCERNKCDKSQITEARTVSIASASSRKPTMSVMIGSSAVAVMLLASTLFTGLWAQSANTSVDQPNPIAQTYPDLISGNLNGTTMIIPIDIALAQSLVPDYPILESSYSSLLPSFPKGMYPLMVSAKHDHDIQLAAYNTSLPDFTVSPSRRRIALT